MQIELCDICGQRLITFVDNGYEYEPIHMKQKTAKKFVLLRGIGTWEPMSICGECRAMLARAREEREHEQTHQKEEAQTMD